MWDAFPEACEIDPDIGDAYVESVSRVGILYARPFPAAKYTAGDTSTEPLPPITNETVRAMPSRLSAMYVPHESEGRCLADSCVSPRLPSRGADTPPRSSRRAASVGDLIAIRRQTAHTPRPTLGTDKSHVRRRDVIEHLDQEFVPAAPESAEMMELLGLKVTREARLSDRRSTKPAPTNPPWRDDRGDKT